MLFPGALRQIRPGAGSNFALSEEEVEHHQFPALVTLGTSRYKAQMSEELGVLLSWTAVIDGQVAVERRIKILGGEAAT